MSITCTLISLAILLAAGCEPSAQKVAAKDCQDFAFAPAKIEIIRLTEFTTAEDRSRKPQIRIYLNFLDEFNNQMKAPGTFRFELYQYVPRSAEPKGKRITIWPDIDITDPKNNNKHWRDFLRSYQFNLDFSPPKNQTYVLQATCLCPEGRRLTAEFLLKSTP